MIILFHLKIDKFYCIGVLNELKTICILIHIKISFYWFNRQELLEKAKYRYLNCGGKEKAAEYYLANKDVLKENANKKYKSLSEEEKEAKSEYGRNRYRNMKENKKSGARRLVVSNLHSETKGSRFESSC